MTPHEVIKDSLEKLSDLTCINGAMSFGTVETPCSGRETGECGSRCQNEQTYDEAMKELVEHIQSSQLSLLLSVKEMVESNKKNLSNGVLTRNKRRKRNGESRFSPTKPTPVTQTGEDHAYDEALSDLITHLNTSIKEIEEKV